MSLASRPWQRGGWMTRILLIGVAAATFACGGSNKATTDANGAAQSSAATASTSSAANANASTAATSGAPQGVEKVTLVGCLQGPSTSAATGTSGTAAERGSQGPGAVTPGAGSSSEPFMLVDATAEAGAAGVGANGAGGSGGPLVSGRSSFVLDAVTVDARNNVNKQVRVTGRLDPRPYATGATTGTAGSSTAGGTTPMSGTASAAAGGSTPASSGAPASGTAMTAGTAASSGTAAATGTTAGSAVVPPVRHLAVDSVEVVSETCAKK
jgi:hypothetical protein